ncbi:dynamin family protein [Demequina rhizosphaerae]|uniref:dynamin family protein n=1 Tax=Demequina rhizosphaerae TaxID=1638985 RepID=UPI000782D236|nr:dynamin family protein [Demequina rhizosphaerae]
MSMRPIKTWSYPGNLLDALVDTRRVVAGVQLPLPVAGVEDARATIQRMLDQLDHHLIPRVREEASPAIVVVAGSTGAGKSTVVNALVGEDLTPSGVLRPTTRVPHLFHHPLDTSVLSDVAKRAKVIATEAVPRGLALVDSPDLDSISGENREIAHTMLEAADLWIFVTTAARYGDAVPWEALRAGADRGASIAVVLNRVTVDVAAQVRRELVDRLAEEHLETLPLFVIPEAPNRQSIVPRDVVGGLGRWLDSVAAASATTIVERTLHGAAESLKEWLETLAEAMDDQSAAAKDVRGEVRRAAAQVSHEGGERWWESIPTGALTARWQQATSDGGALFKLRNSVWVRRGHAREQRDEVLHAIYRDLLEAVESRLVFAASSVAEAMEDALRRAETGVGPWLAERRDPRDARQARERQAADASRRWVHRCQEIVLALPGVEHGIQVIGEPGLTTALASAALGIEEARTVLMILTSPQAVGAAVDEAREELDGARRHCVNRESLDMMRPTDIPSLMPDSSAKIRLRRAELRGLL